MKLKLLLKKNIKASLLVLFTLTFNAIEAQTLTVNAVPPSAIGSSVTISFNYTSTASCSVYAELRIANIDSNGTITQDFSNSSNFISGAFSNALSIASTTTSGSLSISVPGNAVPSSSLPVGKTYSWVYKLTPGVNNYDELGTTYQFTGGTIINSTNTIDSLVLVNPPTEIVAGSTVTVTVNYTCPDTRLIKFGISIYNASGFVSDLVGEGVDNLPATTSSPVTLSLDLTIPSNATPSANLPAGQFYKVDTALFTPNYASYILGNSSNTNLTAPLSTSSFNKSNVKLYPNPVSTILEIDNSIEYATYEIFDISGKLIIKSPKTNLNQINVSELEKGIYILKLDGGESNKFIKE